MASVAAWLSDSSDTICIPSTEYATIWPRRRIYLRYNVTHASLYAAGGHRIAAATYGLYLRTSDLVAPKSFSPMHLRSCRIQSANSSRCLAEAQEHKQARTQGLRPSNAELENERISVYPSSIHSA